MYCADFDFVADMMWSVARFSFVDTMMVRGQTQREVLLELWPDLFVTGISDKLIRVVYLPLLSSEYYNITHLHFCLTLYSTVVIIGTNSLNI
jgi:hypothetical protein